MLSQTLGTALGDWTADTAGLGYTGAALLFGGLLGLLAAAYLWTSASRTLLFWAAFILTRPLGAVVGDFLDKPHSHGGLDLSRYSASAALLAFILGCMLQSRAAARPVWWLRTHPATDKASTPQGMSHSSEPTVPVWSCLLSILGLHPHDHGSPLCRHRALSFWSAPC